MRSHPKLNISSIVIRVMSTLSFLKKAQKTKHKVTILVIFKKHTIISLLFILNPINTGLFGLRNSGGGHYVSPPALKSEKSSSRVNNENICCLKSEESGNHKIFVNESF